MYGGWSRTEQGALVRGTPRPQGGSQRDTLHAAVPSPQRLSSDHRLLSLSDITYMTLEVFLPLPHREVKDRLCDAQDI